MAWSVRTHQAVVMGSPDLQRGLDAVLAGKRVRLAETKPFGCTIDKK